MNTIKKLNFTFLGLAVVTTITVLYLTFGELVYLLDPTLVWTILPFLLFAGIVQATNHPFSQKIQLVLSVTLFLSTFAYFELIHSSDPQTGIVYFFYPLIQFVAIGVVSGALGVFSLFRKKA